jgi:hypothetical protein
MLANPFHTFPDLADTLHHFIFPDAGFGHFGEVIEDSKRKNLVIEDL